MHVGSFPLQYYYIGLFAELGIPGTGTNCMWLVGGVYKPGLILRPHTTLAPPTMSQGNPITPSAYYLPVAMYSLDIQQRQYLEEKYLENPIPGLGELEKQAAALNVYVFWLSAW